MAELLQEGDLWGLAGPGTVLNAAILLVNIGIAWGSRRAHQAEADRLRQQLRERLQEIESEGAAPTRKEIESLRRDVERLDDYITPLVQERLREGHVVKFQGHPEAQDGD